MYIFCHKCGPRPNRLSSPRLYSRYKDFKASRSVPQLRSDYEKQKKEVAAKKAAAKRAAEKKAAEKKKEEEKKKKKKKEKEKVKEVTTQGDAKEDKEEHSDDLLALDFSSNAKVEAEDELPPTETRPEFQCQDISNLAGLHETGNLEALAAEEEEEEDNDEDDNEDGGVKKAGDDREEGDGEVKEEGNEDSMTGLARMAGAWVEDEKEQAGSNPFDVEATPEEDAAAAAAVGEDAWEAKFDEGTGKANEVRSEEKI